MLFYKFSSQLVISLIFLLIFTNDVYGKKQKRKRIRRQEPSSNIDCGIEYLPNTIGITIINDHIYQYIQSDKIDLMDYDNQQKRFKTKQNYNYFKMNLSHGKYSYFDQIILSKNVRDRTIKELHYEHNNLQDDDDIIRKDNLSKNYNSLILFDSKNNLKLVLYETGYLHNHFIIIFDLKKEYFVEYTKTFKNPANIIMISDDQTTAFALTHLINDSMFSMETIFNDNNNNKEENLLFYLHINSKNPKQFQITKNYRNNKLSVDDENYSRKKMQEIFVQYEYRYGFMQTFVDDNDKFKEIVFLFSNKQEKILSFNIDEILSNENMNTMNVSFYQQDYRDFFHC